MTLGSLALGFALGTAAALFHIASLWSRARVATTGNLGLALLTFPISVGVPALFLFLAARHSATAAVAALAGFWVARASAVARVRAS